MTWPARFDEFMRDQLLGSYSGPLLRVLVEAALRVFRVDATSFAGWVDRGWSLVFRSSGAWTVEDAGPGEARLRFDSLPAACPDDEVWPRSIAHTLDAFFVLARTEGECVYRSRDVARGLARNELHWQ